MVTAAGQRDYGFALNLKKLFSHQQEAMNEEDSLKAEALAVSLDRFSVVQLRVGPYGGETKLLVLASVKNEIRYKNPDTGVSIVVPENYTFGYHVENREGNIMITNGINRVGDFTASYLQLGVWDCTDTYDPHSGATRLVVYKDIFTSLFIIDRFLQHGTNLDGYDGGRGIERAFEKYVDEWQLTLENVEDLDDIELGGSRCTVCNGFIPPSESYIVDDLAYCGECYDEYCRTCTDCGVEHHEDYMRYFGDNLGIWLCNHCQRTCDVCLNDVARTHTFPSGRELCDSCEELYISCDICKAVVRKTESIEAIRCVTCNDRNPLSSTEREAEG